MSYYYKQQLNFTQLGKWLEQNDNTKPIFRHDKVIIEDWYNEHEEGTFGENVKIRRN